jgi:hypothetical protein
MVTVYMIIRTEINKIDTDVQFSKTCFKHDNESASKGIQLQFRTVNNKHALLSVVQEQKEMVYSIFCYYKHLSPL